MTLRKTLSCLIAVGCATTLIASAALAQDDVTVSSKLDMAYLSKYIWRGVPLNPDPVVQPSLTFTLPTGFSYNLWMSMNSTDTAIAGKSDMIVEHDHTLNYAATVAGKSMNVGYIYYAFPNTSYLSTQEFYGSVNIGGKFSPTLSVNYDSDEVRGAYFTISGGYCCGLPFSKSTTSAMNLSVKLGYGTGSYIKRAYAGAPDKAAPLDLVLGANTTISLGGNYSLTPSVAYSTILDSEVSKVVSEPDNFIAGLTLSSSF